MAPNKKKNEAQSIGAKLALVIKSGKVRATLPLAGSPEREN
jgi:hypothetical protein